MGAADANGMVVSFIQSLYWEYGSGITCPATGITFENRGAGLLAETRAQPARAGQATLPTRSTPDWLTSTTAACWHSARQGGEGQPQTMTAIYSRYAHFGQELQRAITAPRWLLGTTWADVTSTLKLESRFDPALVAALATAGHVTEVCVISTR
jgi:gamma-glutamyltranspeptidase